MFANGKPRYWLGTYDRWHLLLPVAFLGVLAWLWTFPPAPALPEPVVPVAPPPIAATVIDSPPGNTHFRASRIGDVEGRAQPGSVVVLYYAPAQLALRELGRMEVPADGRYRFRLAGFAPQFYTLKAVAWTRDGRSSQSADLYLWIDADPRPTPSPATKRRKTAR
ncbi:MAG: hypothetical protein DVB31_14905 [Verrucomicrobia bacterium]|nr:MAG: hypothetical protein DVB31_14905 [Verrucomicrobiota bacterium]